MILCILSIKIDVELPISDNVAGSNSVFSKDFIEVFIFELESRINLR